MRYNCFKIFCLVVFGSVAVFASELDFLDVTRLGGDTSIILKGQSVQAYRNPAQNLTADQMRRSWNVQRTVECNSGRERVDP